jgi:hypothetical protein
MAGAKVKLAAAVAAGLYLASLHGGHGVSTAVAALGSQPDAPALSSASGNVAIGQRLASAYGWGSGPQWTCLDELWTRESGWRIVWNYQGSGAYGIPQSLPADKMASAGPDWRTNPATEIRWGLGYVRSTYGTPCGAWAHETANSWY